MLIDIRGLSRFYVSACGKFPDAMCTVPLISILVLALSPLQQRLFAHILNLTVSAEIPSENFRFAPNLGIDRATDHA
jgi:hypothetical protein